MCVGAWAIPVRKYGAARCPQGHFFFISLWIYTMNRCFSSALRRLGTTSVALLISSQVFGQSAAHTGARPVPTTAQSAELRIEQHPLITLNGQADRLSPGARIYNLNNALVMSSTLAGKTVPVRYVRDPQGLVHEIWLVRDTNNPSAR